MTQLLTTSLNQLNPQQQKAIDIANDGPTIVIAGPGTGKTQVITLRIANLLQNTDTNPENILALTFTDSAATNMRDRLVQLIGKAAYYVNISTFHSFCAQVIRQYPDYFPIQRDSEPLSQLECYEIFEELISQTKLKYLQPLNDQFFYLKEVLGRISDLKREGVNPDRFGQILQDEKSWLDNPDESIKKAELAQAKHFHQKQLELLKLYKLYQQEIRSRGRYDFDDMVMLVVEAFEQHELLLRLHQEKLHYFLVDEYQDTNAAQNKVVDLLASYWGEKANLFVVGDPHQAIFRFQGASVENVLGFVERYPRCQVINLDQGYRCPQTIYTAAHQLISHNRLGQVQKTDLNSSKSAKQTATSQQLLFQKLADPLSSAGPTAKTLATTHPSIGVFAAPSQTLEAIFVARRIKQLIDEGVDPSQIAVLYLYNADSVELAQALTKWGIRWEIEGGADLLQKEFTNQLLNFFQVLLELRTTQEGELVYRVMHYPWFELDPLLAMKLGRVAGKLKLSLIEVIDQGYSQVEEAHQEKVLGKTEFNQLKQFVGQLYRWSQLDYQQPFTAWFEQVLKEAGVFAWLKQQPDYVPLLHELNSLYSQAKSMVAGKHDLELADFLRAIQLMRDHQLPIKLEDLNVKQQAVRLATVHKAKGQEWEHVFVTGCVDKKWGNRRVRRILPLPDGVLTNTDLSQKEQSEDERRSFYVALTRAKKQAIISYPETVIAAERSESKAVSQFIGELGELAEKVEDDSLLTNAEQYLEQLIEPPATPVPSPSKEQFFQLLVAQFKLSVTALNQYLRDPQEFVENTLLRLPRAKEPFMAFGTAVHSALEQWYGQYLQTGQLPKEQWLLDQFTQALQQEVLADQEYQRRLEHGLQVLANYHQQQHQAVPEVIEVERRIGYGFSKAVLDQDIHLTGKIDRLDWLDRKKKLVRVVDYKTGKPKSINHIKGLLKSQSLSEREQALPETIRGPYQRQLVFYKLLCQLDRTFNATVESGMFEFVEPAKKGQTKLFFRELEISDEAVVDLKRLIREVMAEIRGLEFLRGLEA